MHFASPAAADIVRSLARTLHRAAASESLANSLPVLRRLLVTRALHGLSLPELFRQRAIVKRKHVLLMLAVESGFRSWEQYSRALTSMDETQLTHFDLLRSTAGHLNPWFSSRAEAEAQVPLLGGRVVEVGGQAVLLVEEA